MEIGIAIRDIFLSEWIAKGPFENKDKGELKLTINTHLHFSAENRMIVVSNAVNYYYEKEPDNYILDCKVSTQYELQHGDNNQIDESTDIPDQLFITMISISISHTRALFLQQAKSNGIVGLMLPMINPTDVYNRLKTELTQKSRVK